jgi:Methane oxygenase PmoA
MKNKACGTLYFLLFGTMMIHDISHGAEVSRIKFPDGKAPVFCWQKTLVAEPKGGEKFATSAFIHPLTTPGGFVCTDLQPSDHLHHLGIWWPWKFVEVDGKKFNTWEIQEGQGAHVARDVKVISSGPDNAEWEFRNETIIKSKEAEPKVVIRETAHVTLTKRGDATVLDIILRQKAADAAVTITAYRYSGFSWRGTHDWNKDNSTMITSSGKGRDDANGTPARWLAVSGPTPKGTASVLILSAAEKLAGTPENVRVWDSKNHNGAPFVNFNPVMKNAMPLDEAHPAVSHRSYRIIASDRAMDAATAEAEWKKWMAKD